MKKTILVMAAAAALCASQAVAAGDPAALRLNEIYASHSGTDDHEMLELIGTPNALLDNYVVCVIEGDGAGAGTLDRAWDLTTYTMPTDGFFVLANTLEPNLDINIGNDNILENGTETFLVVDAANAAAVASILALQGTNVDLDGDLVTDLNLYGTIVDVVAMVDSGYTSATDKVYDGATVIGPDGTYFPAGIFRSGDYPNPWCAHIFLDFDYLANTFVMRTPGAPNVATCWWELGPGCGDSNGRVPNLLFTGSASGGNTLTLSFADVTPPWAAGLGISTTQSNVSLNPNCSFYLGAPFQFVVFIIPAPTFGLNGIIPPVPAAFDLYFQLVMQDGVTMQLVSSNGVGVTIVP